MWGSCVAEKTWKSAVSLTLFTAVTTNHIRLFTKKTGCSPVFALATLCSQTALKFEFVKKDPLSPISLSAQTTTPHPDTGPKITSAGLHCLLWDPFDRAKFAIVLLSLWCFLCH